MKRFAFTFAIAGFAALVSIRVCAQESTSSQVVGVVERGNTTIVFERSNAGLDLDRLSAFSQVASSDPTLARKLAKNPSLVRNEKFISEHLTLQQYLEKYPSAREDIVANPGNYLTPVNGSTWSHAPAGMKD